MITFNEAKEKEKMLNRLSQLSYYGQYNSYNNSYRTNYVSPHFRSNGTYVNDYYRS